MLGVLPRKISLAELEVTVISPIQSCWDAMAGTMVSASRAVDLVAFRREKQEWKGNRVEQDKQNKLSKQIWKFTCTTWPSEDRSGSVEHWTVREPFDKGGTDVTVNTLLGFMLSLVEICLPDSSHSQSATPKVRSLLMHCN